MVILKQSVANGRNFAIIRTIVTQRSQSPTYGGSSNGHDGAIEPDAAVLND
jgi:hypothetical protein